MLACASMTASQSSSHLPLDIARVLDRKHRLAYAVAYVTGTSMSVERHVKLFKNGRNQAVRIPREFELPGDEAVMRKEGDRLIIEPAPPTSLLQVLAKLKPLDEILPPVPDLPVDDVTL